MNKMLMEDTIVAISTPIGEGGIGIVRLSGKDALKIANSIFVSKDNKKPSEFKTYTVHYGHIIDKRAGVKNRGIVDEVILTVMRAPKSYTKEDVVEINCHSGIVPLRRILDLALTNGTRLAEPGEFTKRAFLNGRIDIMQAEAVLDIIKAKTDLSLRAALNSLEGTFSARIRDIRAELLEVLVSIEAFIDFSEEEDVERTKRRNILGKLNGIEKDITTLISKACEGKVLRQGIRTVICGSPNVGKSSLLNAILNESRAIVTNIPGTTRDTIEETANIKGIPVVLVDTAGIRASDHPVEKEGVRRSQSSMQNSDLVLLVLDNGRKINKNDQKVINSIKNKENVIIVVNKKDLTKHLNLKYIKNIFPKNPIIHTCCIDLSGIDNLKDSIKNIIFKGKAPSADIASVSNERQLNALRQAIREIKEAIISIKNKVSMDCVAIYVRSSIEFIGEMTGHSITEETLDKIFSEFCIGK